MSTDYRGLPPLFGPEVSDCCRARFSWRQIKVLLGTRTDSDFFTCAKCGHSYRRGLDGCWHGVTGLEDLRDMVAHDARGSLSNASDK
jgi:hypothetical protein